MKYCPYCGAGLPDGAVSFCPECGSALPGGKGSMEKPDKKKHRPAEKEPIPKKRSNGRYPEPAPDVPADEMQDADGAYDGYYDDIRPMDEGRQREGIDRLVVKKIAALIGALAVVIGLCIALMYLL